MNKNKYWTPSKNQSLPGCFLDAGRLFYYWLYRFKENPFHLYDDNDGEFILLKKKSNRFVVCLNVLFEKQKRKEN